MYFFTEMKISKMGTHWLIVALYLLIGSDVIGPVRSLNPSIIRSLGKFRRSLGSRRNPTQAQLSLGEAYCTRFYLSFVADTPNEEPERTIANDEFLGCYHAIVAYLQANPTGEHTVITYAETMRDAGMTYDEALEVMNHMSGLGYNMETALMLFQSLGDDNYFLTDGHYVTINLPENIWRYYQNEDYHDIDIFRCYNMFDPTNNQDGDMINVLAYYANWYNEAEETYKFLRELGYPNHVCCRCYEVYWFYHIFKTGYHVNEEFLKTSILMLCFGSKTKSFFWKHRPLNKIYKEIRTKESVTQHVPPAITRYILRGGEKIARSQWMLDAHQYSLPFEVIGLVVNEHYQDGDVFSFLSVAIRNHMSQNLLMEYISGTNFCSESHENGQGYFLPMNCKALLLKTIYQSDLQHFWYEHTTNSVKPFLDYAFALAAYANRHSPKKNGCLRFQDDFKEIGQALALGKWNPELMTDVMVYANKNKIHIHQTAGCLHLLSALQERLLTQLDDGISLNFTEEDVTSVTENYKALMNGEPFDCVAMYDDYISNSNIQGAVELFQIILERKHEMGSQPSNQPGGSSTRQRLYGDTLGVPDPGAPQYRAWSRSRRTRGRRGRSTPDSSSEQEYGITLPVPDQRGSSGRQRTGVQQGRSAPNSSSEQEEEGITLPVPDLREPSDTTGVQRGRPVLRIVTVDPLQTTAEPTVQAPQPPYEKPLPPPPPSA